MRRPIGYLALAVALAAAVLGSVVLTVEPLAPVTVKGFGLDSLVAKALFVVAIGGGLYGVYLLVSRAAVARAGSKRRAHDVGNVLRLLFGFVGSVAVLGVLTDQWVGVLLSLGVVGFAITFALQQPLLSFLAWWYIMLKRPYVAGDRVRIDDAKGDVISIDFLVTTIWEVNRDLVSSNQPSGRVVTVPNSVVLSREVVNFGGAGIEHVWNELSVQVAYETDLGFAREAMVEEADDYLGDEMAGLVESYREKLAETPVELEVNDRPTVNVVQEESWVELRLRYMVHPRRGTQVRNELYSRIIERFNGHPDRVKFPLGRNR